MRKSLGLCLGLLAVALLLLWSCSKDSPVSPTETPVQHEPLTEATGLWIAPVQGLTTAWYPAPAKFTVSNDVRTIKLKVVTTEKAKIVWSGAVETSRTAYESYAECALPAPGSHQLVKAEATEHDGTRTIVETFSSGILVSNRGAGEMQIGSVALSDAEPRLDQYTTAAERIRVLLDGRVIAAVKSTGTDSYRTAAGAPLHVKATTNELGTLVEWRLDGKPLWLGTEGDVALPQEPGKHVLSVGPPSHAHSVAVQTFGTSVVVEGGGGIAAGKPVTFHVTTNPPGFESEVLWMSGTLFGTAEPALGKGASFTAVFDRPWPTTPDGATCVGVRAGSAAVIVDDKITMGYDLSRLDSDLDDAAKALGQRACCITDSLARAQTFDALNTLVKSRDALNNAINVYNSLSKLTRKAIDLAYGDFQGDMRVQILNLEAGIAKIKNQPDCSNASLLKGVQALSFCQDLQDFLYGFGQALTAMGLILLAIGIALIWIPGVGAPITLAGILFGTAGGILVLISYTFTC
ncbi:MAG TPA: hypothetical protein VJS69_11345 [Candidatus Krumholzibacteria bacterium]|nr:hypothetical protein [Candidatus Krumholzibacteria bacterium]